MGKNRLSVLYGFVLVCLISTFTAACGSQNQQEQTAQTVVERIYTCPNKDFKVAYVEDSQPIDKTTVGEVTAITAKNSKSMKIIEDLFQPYFTPSAYESFISKAVFYKYQMASIENKWSSEVKNIVVKKSNNQKYTYTCDVAVTNENNETTTQNGSGNFEFDETGKITWFDEYLPFQYQ